MGNKTAGVILMFFSAFLLGCATTAPLDPNRSFLGQPDVTAGVKEQFTSKNLRDVPIHVAPAKFYDASNTIELGNRVAEDIREKGPEAGLKYSFIKEFPPIPNPPEALAVRGALFVTDLKEAFAGMGYKLSETPCGECLIVFPDFAEHRLSLIPFIRMPWRFAYGSARVQFLGEVILMGHSDAVIRWYPGIRGVTDEEAIKMKAKFVAEDVVRGLTQNVAIWRRELAASAGKTATK